MPSRSQRHLREIQGYDSGGVTSIPTLTGLSPDVASITAVGAVNRTIAALGGEGGLQPYSYAISAADGLSMNISGNLLRTNADPVGSVAVHNPTITVTDAAGQQLAQPIAVTVT